MFTVLAFGLVLVFVLLLFWVYWPPSLSELKRNTISDSLSPIYDPDFWTILLSGNTHLHNDGFPKRPLSLIDSMNYVNLDDI